MKLRSMVKPIAAHVGAAVLSGRGRGMKAAASPLIRSVMAGLFPLALHCRDGPSVSVTHLEEPPASCT